jgi:cell division initiation protein
MLTPVDLETTVFHRSFRGYNKAEVQDFMDRIIQDYEHLYRENIELKERIEELNVRINQYSMIEETLRNTMVLAQETAEEVKKTAREQAELIIKEARVQGEQVKIKTKEEIQIELRNLALLKNQVEYFKCQFKSFLSGLLDLAEKQLDLPIEWDKYSKPAVSSTSNTTVSPEIETTSKTEAVASSKVPF